jgi:S-adenosylmethionine:tRNA ribosyltransferase-isomerase
VDLAAFDYHLPEELIAQEPLPDRAGSRMLVVHRAERRWEDCLFRDFPSFLDAGDCVVLNDSRVFPARLFGHREGVRSLPVGKNNAKRREHLSGRVEVFLVRSVSPDGRDWEALVRPGRKMRLRERIRFEGGLEGEIVARGDFGERTIRFSGADDLFAAFERIGHMPLPPYIKRPDRPADRERYQTVFAREKGSVAAPTAGLHFTGEILD